MNTLVTNDYRIETDTEKNVSYVDGEIAEIVSIDYRSGKVQFSINGDIHTAYRVPYSDCLYREVVPC